MKKEEYEIVERSSGYWITDNFGVLNGPYDTVGEAEDDIPRQAALQYPLPLDLEKNDEERKEHKWEIVDGEIRRME
tara:strand:- start:644 stop:871 length:228 start_codon:yes stop_codon:yes gene_type:complete